MKQGLAMGGRALSTYVVSMVLLLLVGLGISDDWYWLQLVINVAMLGGMGMLLFSDGGVRGERACTLDVTRERMRADGHTPDPSVEHNGFSQKAMLVAYLTAVLPLLLIAGVNLAVEPYYPAPVFESSPWLDEALSGEHTEAEIQALVDANAPTDAEPTLVNWANVVARIAFIPFLASYRWFYQDPHGLNLLFVAFALLYPLPEIAGYAMGPKLRVKKLQAIQKGKKRKMRNLKVNQKRREPPKPEV